MKIFYLFFLFTIQLLFCNPAKSQESDNFKIVETIEIDSVWVANKVSFDIKTLEKKQYVTYYNKDRYMTIASRALNSSVWEKKILDNKLKWDSHNYVELGIDEKGYIHVTGNMHNDSLIYYRSNIPYDIQSIVPIHKMVGTLENSVTYPFFFNDKAGSLFFTYRIGSSGNGKVILNKFLTDQLKWERYIKTPIFDGLEKNKDRSAYFQFSKDKNSVFHYIWMWRWSPLVDSCHQLCYASTSDQIHWKNASGESINLPIKPDIKSLIIDNVPQKGGLHNGKYRLLFTQDQQPIIAYLKYDENGKTQLYLSKFKENKWLIKKMTNWNFRWKFIGGGDQMTEGANFNFAGFSDEGYMAINWKNEINESGQLIFNPENFEIVTQKVTIKNQLPKNLNDRITDEKELSVNLVEDKELKTNGEKYFLKWESKERSHGNNAPKIMPSGPRSKLLLIKLKK
jgi:hypothetical protein